MDVSGAVRHPAYQRGFADGVREAVRVAGKERGRAFGVVPLEVRFKRGVEKLMEEEEERRKKEKKETKEKKESPEP